MAKNSVHVLFVHGVGRHSQLSSLLGAYQALRSDLRSTEVPHPADDLLNKRWQLEEFNQVGPPPYLKLTTLYPEEPGPLNAYIYEANYAELSGVIRENQPLDITYLFIGFDLAVNVARQRLNRAWSAGALSLLRDTQIAAVVQRLSEVFVAATVPILGIPSLLLRNYTKGFVSNFVRFFEDIATFAMDGQSEKLLAEHFKKNVSNIISSKQFTASPNHTDGDTLVIIAHSLGTVVTHNYLIGQWQNGGPQVPQKLLTFGSPIGLVCWMWLFLDFQRMTFDASGRRTGDEYFAWTPVPAPTSPLQKVQWINVVNHLDPIATVFPTSYASLAMQEPALVQALDGKAVLHHYIRTGGLLSVGAAHNDYFVDRRTFCDIVSRVAGLAPDADPPPPERSPGTHWQDALLHLRLLWWLSWLLGIGALYGYFRLLTDSFPESRRFAYMIPYIFPPLTIAFLGFFQKLFFGRPTKRTREEVLGAVYWLDMHSFPYKLRRLVTRIPIVTPLFALLLSRSPKVVIRIGRLLLGFIPTFFAMFLPLIFLAPPGQGLTSTVFSFVADHPVGTGALIILFALYTTAFAACQFVGCWREVLVKVGVPANR